MKKTLVLALCAAAAIAFFAGAGFAGAIERACNGSERASRSRGLCSCIQQVADETLRRGDQSRAAGFFKNPEKAHKVWMSQTKSDDAFWDRYKAFGAQAEARCKG